MKLKFALTTLLFVCLLNGSATALQPAAVAFNDPPATTTFSGMCEASGAVALGQNMFVVANDEDNLLRVYSKEGATTPLQVIRLAELFKGQITNGDKPEIDPGKNKVDIEGATWLGDMIFWIGSHSLSSEGAGRPSRESLFALKLNYNKGELSAVPVGKVYKALLTDLAKVPAYDVYDLKKAKTITPKEIGGLSIEGLAATPAGELLIGFRNPLRGGQMVNGRLVGGKALIVTLKNPGEVIADTPVPGRFGDPIELDLGGFGIRSIDFNERLKRYVIVAGPYDKTDETFGLYQWTGNKDDKPQAMDNSMLKGLFPEAVFFYPLAASGKEQMQLLSDDGKCTPGDNAAFRSLLQIL